MHNSSFCKKPGKSEQILWSLYRPHLHEFLSDWLRVEHFGKAMIRSSICAPGRLIPTRQCEVITLCAITWNSGIKLKNYLHQFPGHPVDCKSINCLPFSAES